jgi:hypothetical protein
MNQIDKMLFSLLSVGLLAGTTVAAEPAGAAAAAIIEPTWESMAAHYQVPEWDAAMPTQPDPACVSKAQRR